MATLEKDSKLLRIFIGDADKLNHTPLYEAILLKARENGLAGGTVIKGTMSFGASSIVHTAKIFDLSEDLPIVIEIIDREDKIRDFIKVVGAMMEEAACGGLITVEKAEVAYYKPRHSKVK
jgi:PII-like signaling protein